jgi:hypothetical protein
MPLTTNKIGDFEFIALRGEPVIPKQAVAIMDRPGIDGSEKILLGKKGVPFALVSQVDQASYQAAKETLLEYQDLIAEDSVALVQAGVDSEQLGYRVQVLNVNEAPGGCRPIRGAVGNALNQPSEAFLEAIWELIAVPFTAP